MICVWLAAVVGISPSPVADDPPKKVSQPEIAPAPRPFDVATAAAAMAAESDRLERTFYDELRAAKTRDENRAANSRYSQASGAWINRAFAFILRHQDHPGVFGLLVKYLDRADVRTDELAAVIREHHLSNPLLSRAFDDLARSIYPEAKQLLADLADTHPNRATRGRAAFAIGSSAKSELTYDGQYGRKPMPADRKREARKRAEQYLTRVANDFADVPPSRGSGRPLGKQAADQLAGLRNLDLLVVGKVAPDIAGEDIDGKAFKLSDYRGKVVLLDFWEDW